jgi:transposase
MGPERRRCWSEDEKTTILDELAKPGMRGTEVARRHGVSSGLLYTWRKERRAAATIDDGALPGRRTVSLRRGPPVRGERDVGISELLWAR